MSSQSEYSWTFDYRSEWSDDEEMYVICENRPAQSGRNRGAEESRGAETGSVNGLSGLHLLTEGPDEAQVRNEDPKQPAG